MRSIKALLNIGTRRERNRGNLWASVQARRVVEFTYHSKHYVVEPFALGLTRYGSPDNESLVGYQTEGSSEPYDSEGWRIYRTSEITRLKVSTEQFNGDRPGYDPDNLDMVKVFCSVRWTGYAKDKAGKTRSPPVVKPLLYAPPCPPARRSLTHNEQMLRFRQAHHVPVPEPYVNPLPNPPVKPPPERPESKIKPLYGHRYEILRTKKRPTGIRYP